MIEPTKEQLAEALRDYPSWGHAYVAEKARADGLEEQNESLRTALTIIRDRDPVELGYIQFVQHFAFEALGGSNPANESRKEHWNVVYPTD